ncbi:MAG: putative toxin-antitoxin system toxin component, PIN family [Thermodesulfobacteriota bacterium]
MNPPKVVFDTNILISAYFFGGQPRVTLDIARSGKVILLQSTETVAEFVRVLGYRKFGLTADEIKPLVEDLLGFSEKVSLGTPVKYIKEDPTDNVFLTLARQGHAKYIVSGDSHLLNIRSFSGIDILTVRRFLSRFGKL